MPAAGSPRRSSATPTHPTDAWRAVHESRALSRAHLSRRAAAASAEARSGPKGRGSFERVSWDEALDDIAARLKAIAARDPRAHRALLLRRHHGARAGRGDGRALLPQARREPCSTARSARARAARRMNYTIGTRTGPRDGGVRRCQAHRLLGRQRDRLEPASLELRADGQAQGREARRDRPVPLADGREVPRAHRAAAGHRRRAGARAHARADPGRAGSTATTSSATRSVSTSSPRSSSGYTARARGGAVRPGSRANRALGARLLAHRPRRDPVELRHAASARRRQRGARDHLPAVPDRRAGAATRAACCSRRSGMFNKDNAALQRPDLLDGADGGLRDPRTINMSTIGRDLLRAPIRRSRRSSSTTATRWPWRRNRKRVAAGFAREDLFTVVLEHFQTDTADYADYVLPATTQLEHVDVHSTYGHLYVVANDAGDRAARRGAAEHGDLPATRRAHGLRRPVLSRQRRGDRGRRVQAPSGTTAKIDWRELEGQGLAATRSADAVRAVRRRRLPDAFAANASSTARRCATWA